MTFYILSIVVGMVVIGGVNLLINPYVYSLSVWYIIVAVIVNTIAVIAIDGVFAFLIRRLPSRWFSHEKKAFQVSKRERRFYEAIGIRKWKDNVLELGTFTKFSKKKIANPSDNQYVSQFLLESNYGYVIHLACVFVGFLIVFFYPLRYFLMFGIPVALVNALLNVLPAFILRYNTPKLLALYKLNERNAKRAAAHTALAAENTASETDPTVS